MVSRSKKGKGLNKPRMENTDHYAAVRRDLDVIRLKLEAVLECQAMVLAKLNGTEPLDELERIRIRVHNNTNAILKERVLSGSF